MKPKTIYIIVLIPVVLISLAIGGLVGWGLAPAEVVHKDHVGKPAEVWICSMHPQIRRSQPGKCPICPMDLILVSDYSKKMSGMRELTISEAAKALMDIETAAVERKFVTAEIRMVGKIDYDETLLAYITAWVPGRLDRVFVDYTGVEVNKGDHLVEIYSPELLSAQAELLQAIEAVKRLEKSDVSIVREATEATVVAAREKLRLWGLTPQQIAEIEKRGKATDHLTIYAPIGGVVVHKNARQGMYVKTGTRIFTIADLSYVWVKLDAYESDLQWIRPGQKLEFTTVAYPGEKFTGWVSFVDPILDETTRTVKVRITAPNVRGRLKPGMFVKAVVRVRAPASGKTMDAELAGKWICRHHPDVVSDVSGKCSKCGWAMVKAESLYGDASTGEEKPLVIPASAVLKTGTRAVVYVEVPGKDKPTFEGREILLGPRAGDYYLVRSGLKEGERVVTRGNFKIDSALQIQAKPSMMSPAGGPGAGSHSHH